MRIIIGLGNPEETHKGSRHNVGFSFCDTLHDGSWYFERGSASMTARTTIAETPVILGKPQTYMNRSGIAVAHLLTAHEATAADLIVVHDDLDLAFGTVRVSHNRGAGGHNGVRSIIASLGTQAFTRIRIGIAPTTETGEVVKPTGGLFTSQQKAISRFVLKPFSTQERATLPDIFQRARDHLQDLLATTKNTQS